jgi:SlyX protein
LNKPTTAGNDAQVDRVCRGRDDPRVEALEAELAFQGEAVRALNDALGRQQGDILLLQRQVALLAQEVKSLRQAHAPQQPHAGAAADDKPPHY